MYRVIVAGGREFKNYELLEETLDTLHKEHPDLVVVSGTARGADKLGEKWAELHGVKVLPFPADWDTYGKSAGYKRNLEMALNADALVAFWDGVSKGTGNMIRIARDKDLPTLIIEY